MRAHIRSSIFLPVLVTVLAACVTNGEPNAPDTGSGRPVAVGTTTTATFGAILTGPNGMALYTKASDSATVSTCTGSCRMAWPPLEVSPGQQAVGGPGVDGTFGTLTRPDGTTQATYNGLPLYFYQADTSPGDATGNGIDGFSVATPSSGSRG